MRVEGGEAVKVVAREAAWAVAAGRVASWVLVGARGALGGAQEVV